MRIIASDRFKPGVTMEQMTRTCRRGFECLAVVEGRHSSRKVCARR